MSRDDVTEKIVAAKVRLDMKWADVAEKVGLSKEWVTAAMELRREPDPKGDRVRIAMSGKFLPYKTY